MKKYLINLVQALIVGGIVGLLVGIYQLGISFINYSSNFFYQSREWYLILIMMILTIVCSILNFFIICHHPDLDASGIPSLELGIRKKRPIFYKFEIFLMMVNSYLSTFVGFPLGSEGPSVVIAGKTGKLGNDLCQNDDMDNVSLASGAGFAAAFMSPLAGIFYIFEECLHKFDIKLLLRAIIFCLSAYFISILINDHLLLTIDNFNFIPFTDYYIFIFILVVDLIVSLLFTKGLILIKKVFLKFEKKKIIYYRGLFFYLIILIINFSCLGYLGSGSNIINNIVNNKILWIVIVILIFRFVATLIFGSGKVTGGLVIPLMTLGALSGQIINILMTTLFNFSSEYYQTINLISMCLVFSIVTKTPLTGTALVFTTFARNDFFLSFGMIPITLLLFMTSSFISVKIFHNDCIYEQLMKLTEKIDVIDKEIKEEIIGEFNEK